MPHAILLLSCPDRRGLVSQLSGFIAEHGGNIIHADHHNDIETGIFLSRLEWDLDGFDLPTEKLAETFAPLGREINAQWSLQFTDRPPRVSIWATREDHCLLDLLWRHGSGDLPCTIPLVISNHRHLESVVRQHGIHFEWIEVTRDSKAAAERRQLALLHEHHIDLVILAKYMQILSPALIAEAPPVINIHHSFLPAFPGANPYRQAFDRGVKIIGATAHYATADLDEGPIIDQDVVRISHRDGVQDLIRRGRDLERTVLARAVRSHLESRVLRYRNKTVVFS